MAVTDDLLGQSLDEYELEKLLGQGGMARVYRGIDARLKRYVAIKVIQQAHRGDDTYKMRFEREAQAIAQLEHSHIVSIYRYGEVGDLLYMAMQYVEGIDLHQLLLDYREQDEYMPPDEILRTIQAITSGLDYAHERGVIHRDIKPSNIMINKREGQAIITDFGLALLADVGTRGEILGSPHYIAPEQVVSSAGAVPQSDLYAVGVILYEIFTGVVPFDGPSAMDVALLHVSEEPRPPREIRPKIHPQIEAVILRAMEKEPEARFQTGKELFDALSTALKRTVLGEGSSSSRTVLERVISKVEEDPLPPLPAMPVGMSQEAKTANDEMPLPAMPVGLDEASKPAVAPPTMVPSEPVVPVPVPASSEPAVAVPVPSEPAVAVPVPSEPVGAVAAEVSGGREDEIEVVVERGPSQPERGV
ncbi:MAG TPA: serine/threonine-protein kinase, partial [Anaerolineae bacterium]|nr:serine/threonine-protein kinase [Anaerolineae bacterium]